MSVRTRDWLKFGTLVAIAFVFGLAFASTLGLPKKGDALESIATSPPTAVAPQVTVPVTTPVSALSDALVGAAEHTRLAIVFFRSQQVVRGDNQLRPPGSAAFFPTPRRRPLVEQ